ncbi:chemotaxis protein CheW [Shewanella sp. SR44-3]|uniref:chemotaxis protein CheW n=1 Tax=unclassified Shewanella TaxID=196818 RepID=UPI0015F90777|nr:chemotaxis protein CheW [Shewanella sp. SR44-3]MBB1268058.1 chemotaxis protein CheW [Shewanella sp. SR44-3]
MSKSVDDAVVDFFDLLLKEKSAPIVKVASQAKQFKPVEANKVLLEPKAAFTQVAPSSVARSILPKPIAQVNRDVDKKALEKLLEAVSKPAIATETTLEQGIKAKAELIRQAIKLQPEAKVPSVVSESDKNKVLEDKEITLSADKNMHLESVVIDQDLTAVEPEIAVSLQTQTGSVPPSITKDLQEVLDDEFQVLFFNVAGLTLAVPLVSLGGIVKIERISHLIGRPKWFKGVQTHRDTKLNVVDTCAWVMPEKYSQELAESIDYQYLVLLEDSEWGLACESLVNAVKINKSHVNWRDKPGKRPWLAGVVKEQMCGILHVQALIEMLDAGLGCQDSID